MALHNYIYVKHHTDIETERKIAREHDPRPTLLKTNPDFNDTTQTENALLHPHTHLHIKEDWEHEVKSEKWDDESSSDTDYLKKRLNLESEVMPIQVKNHHHHRHHHHHHHHNHQDESSESSVSDSSRPKSAVARVPLSLSKEDIDIILCAKPMKISRSQQSQNGQLSEQPSIEKKPLKDTKYVVVGGKKKKLKSRFTRMKRTSSNQGAN
ncbi:hypothetical protein CANINC_004740 [Pichia inconspicua]|uniref:Uncharacterized protein n=1 Tax=Pichia inconspicua TaxID=52247 RepID=A0A4T0WXA1_9ASCO|nr:hypothetical protein CANINC_004740 [[Candida] inconspicua]